MPLCVLFHKLEALLRTLSLLSKLHLQTLLFPLEQLDNVLVIYSHSMTQNKVYFQESL